MGQAESSLLFRRRLFLLLALCCMVLIFCFSAQSGPSSDRASMPIAVWLGRALPLSVPVLHHFVRKVAHFTVYLLLSVFVSGWLSTFRLRPAARLFAAVLFCAAYAAGDEFHQSFTALRTPSGWDVLLDTMGALTGAVLWSLFFRMYQKRMLRKKVQP
ncbi:MAG: VanZ family protein [Oscillospiraceae bacterium]|nr:VanZ family protein [Oscillospiraceae bacterium]MDD3262042.1 VanZ family protein [Oscillospiraceae bacterium]